MIYWPITEYIDNLLMYIDMWNKQWGFISAGNLERNNISWSLSHSMNPSNWLSEEPFVFSGNDLLMFLKRN